MPTLDPNNTDIIDNETGINLSAIRSVNIPEEPALLNSTHQIDTESGLNLTKIRERADNTESVLGLDLIPSDIEPARLNEYKKIAHTLNMSPIDVHRNYDGLKDKINRTVTPEGRNLWDTAEDSFISGIGNTIATTGQSLSWLGAEDYGRDFIKFGQQIRDSYKTPMPPEEFTYDKVLDPQWWATMVTESVPFTLSLIPAAVLAAYGSAGLTATALTSLGVSTAAGTLGAFGVTVGGAIGGATISRLFESALEAGGTYEEALSTGMTKEGASLAADETFKGNLALGGLDALQFALAFTPLKGIKGSGARVMAKRIAAGTGIFAFEIESEREEEMYQEYVQKKALGDNRTFWEIRKDPSTQEAGAIGALFGLGLGGAGSVWTALKSEVVDNITGDVKKDFRETFTEAIRQGADAETATLLALDKISSTPEGKSAVEEIMTGLKDRAEGKPEIAVEGPVGEQEETTFQSREDYKATEKKPVQAIISIPELSEEEKSVAMDIIETSGLASDMFLVEHGELVIQGENAQELESKLKQVKDFAEKSNIDIKFGIGNTLTEAEQNLSERIVSREREELARREGEITEEDLDAVIRGEKDIDVEKLEVTEDLDTDIEEAPPQRVITQEAYDKAQESLKGKLSGLKSGIDPTTLKEFAVIGAYHIESGVRTFKEWSELMIKNYGEKIKPHLKVIWDEAKGLARKITPQYNPEIVEYIKQRVTEGEAGQRFADEFGQWQGQGSTFPEWFKNKGLTKAQVLNIVAKVEQGKKLTDNQTEIFNDLVEKASQEFYKFIADVPDLARFIKENGLDVGDELKIFDEWHKIMGVNEAGELILKNGQTIAIDPFEESKFPVTAVREAAEKAQKRTEAQRVNAGILQWVEKALKPKKLKTKKIIRESTGQVREDELVKEYDALKAGMRKAVQAARKAYREGDKAGVARERARIKEYYKTVAENKIARILTEKQKMANRRSRVRAIRDSLQLTDNDLRKVSTKDYRNMSDYEFKLFLDEVYEKAIELQENSKAKNEVRALIEERQFKNWENLRLVMDLPAIDKMTTEQANAFYSALEPYQQGDRFLSKRKLELVDRTDFVGIKTIREALEKTAEKIGVPFTTVQGTSVSEFDRFKPDTLLAKTNPVFHYIVQKMVMKDLIARDAILEVEDKVNDLAKEARNSRQKTLKESAWEFIAPQDRKVFQFIESSPEQRTLLARELTNEELDFANYVSMKMSEALGYLMSINALKKSRFEDAYINHMRKGLLESIKDGGLKEGVRNIFDKYRHDEQVANILDGSTGDILPLEKFIPNTLFRVGNLDPTQNVAKAFLQYWSNIEKKKALDSTLTELDIIVHALEPEAKTPRGLKLDKSLSKFFKEWVNTKKGRHTTLFAKQGGKLDVTLRALRSFTALKDLGGNIIIGFTARVGEASGNFIQLGHKNFAKGLTRKRTDKGSEIVKKYRNFIGKPVWEELNEASKDAGDKIAEALFGLFTHGSLEANKTFLLGSLTTEEYNSGNISDERLAQLRLDMGEYRVVSGSTSVFGATPEVKTELQYKRWAVPMLQTTYNNLKVLATKGQFNSKEAWQLYRSLELVLAVSMAGSFIIDEDDDTFIGRARKKIFREMMSIYGALDANFWANQARVTAFIKNILVGLKQLATLEEYEKSSSRWGYEEGELKGVRTLKTELVPRALTQLEDKNQGRRRAP